MGDKFWWWLKRIRLMAAFFLGGLAGCYFVYKSGFKSDLAYDTIGFVIGMVVGAAIYYVPEWIIRLITHAEDDEELEEWLWVYKQKKKNGRPENEDRGEEF